MLFTFIPASSMTPRVIGPICIYLIYTHVIYPERGSELPLRLRETVHRSKCGKFQMILITPTGNGGETGRRLLPHTSRLNPPPPAGSSLPLPRDFRHDFSDVPESDLEALNAEMQQLNAPGAERERSPGQQVLRDHQWFGTQSVAKSQRCACVVS